MRSPNATIAAMSAKQPAVVVSSSPTTTNTTNDAADTADVDSRMLPCEPASMPCPWGPCGSRGGGSGGAQPRARARVASRWARPRRSSCRDQSRTVVEDEALPLSAGQDDPVGPTSNTTASGSAPPVSPASSTSSADGYPTRSAEGVRPTAACHRRARTNGSHVFGSPHRVCRVARSRWATTRTTAAGSRQSAKGHHDDFDHDWMTSAMDASTMSRIEVSGRRTRRSKGPRRAVVLRWSWGGVKPRHATTTSAASRIGEALAIRSSSSSLSQTTIATRSWLMFPRVEAVNAASARASASAPPSPLDDANSLARSKWSSPSATSN